MEKIYLQQMVRFRAKITDLTDVKDEQLMSG
jgi:hypothetical protein